MTTNIPPQARGVIAVDFDGTIVEWGALAGPFIPKDGAVENINALAEMGFTIIVFTSRLSGTWLNQHVPQTTAEEQGRIVCAALDELGVTYHGITGEKIPAEWYIDDRGIGFRDNWDDVLSEVVWSREVAA